MLHKNIYIPLLFLCCLAGSSCKKFLDEKPDKKLVVPESLKDLQALLDNRSSINGTDLIAGETSADNYYITDAGWASLYRESDRRGYTWEKDYVFTSGDNEWVYSYSKVYRANVVLDNIQKIQVTASNNPTWNDVKGQALYIRSYAFLQTVIIWSAAYEEARAETDLGIPLRLKGDFTEVSTRPSIKATYDQIISDLKQAVQFLPERPIHVIRPSKAAAYALLARTFLSMRKYDLVSLYADSSLKQYDRLLDYNSISPTATYPFKKFNEEVVSDNYNNVNYEPVHNRMGRIDSTLYNSYAANDLRKTAFFSRNNDGSFSFKGSYMGWSTLFTGLTTAEIYLMRAEANARLGKVAEAMNDLNNLLKNRWKKNTYIPYAITDKNIALTLILEERRKELLMRGLRWMDIKRLNKEGANITLTRKLNGQTYTLPPNDLRYALPIPENVIELSGMPQNPR